MVFRLFSSSQLTVPKASTTVGITVTMTSQNICTCNLNSWYLTIFSSHFTLIFWSPRIAMLMILHSLFSLSMTAISILWSSFSLSDWIPKSRSILRLLLSSTGSGWCKDNLSLHSISNFLQKSQCFIFQVCRVSSCIGFQLGQNTNWKYGWHFQLSFCRACIKGTRPGDQCHFLLHLFCVLLHRLLSPVPCFSLPAFIHWHLLWSCIPSASLRNWSCNAFFFHAVFLSLFSSSLSSLQCLFFVVPNTCSLQKSVIAVCSIIKEVRSF